MKKSAVNRFPQGSPEYIILHAKWQRSRGRNPSATFSWERNPRRALRMAERMAYFPESGTYLDGKCPKAYVCSKCGATNCKLWRQYQTFAEHIELLCIRCAGEDQGKDISSANASGKIDTEYGSTDQIGWLVPAVPTEDNETYWGYTSVPQPGCIWWNNLPTFGKARVALPV